LWGGGSFYVNKQGANFISLPFKRFLKNEEFAVE
jgi:hypothetical protein